MSRISFGDYMDQSEGGVDVPDPLTQLKKDLDDIDFPANLNFENPGLMSSDFFDSVLSMEQSTFGCELETGEPLSNIDSDFGLSNSDADEMRMANSCSPDSGSSSTDYQFKDLILLNNNGLEYKNNNDLVMKFLNQAEGETITNNTQSIQVPTKVFINNPNGKRVIVTKPYATKSNYLLDNRKTVSNNKQVLRVQSISGNGRSVLLPFNVTKMKNIKIINGKELQAENIKITKVTDLSPVRKSYMTSPSSYVDSYEASSPETFDDDSDSVDAKSDNDRQYPILVLTDEEKRLLTKEGIRLPTHYPLTKQEERELKRIRRKIRNKISAQDSRKRKKEYVDGLEERIKQGAEEKKILMNRVKHLQQQNNRLIAQMNKLQALVFNTSGSKATPTTCLLIVLVSAVLVSLPNLRVPQNNNEWKEQQQITARRALLSSQQATNEDSVNLEEFLLFNRDSEDSELKNVMFEEDNNTGDFSMSKYIKNFDKTYEDINQNFLNKENSKTLLDSREIDKDVRSTFTKMKNFFQKNFDELKPYGFNPNGKLDSKQRIEKKFIEPDIDDGPDIYHGCSPAKRIKMTDQIEPGVDCIPIIPKSDSAPSVVSATVSVNASKKE